MSPRIIGHNLDVSPEDRDFISGKVARLRKFYERISEVSVIFDAVKTTVQAEILIQGPRCNLHVRNAGEDILQAFDGALDKAERSLKKMKDKLWGDKKSRRRSVSIRRFNPNEIPVEPVETSAGEFEDIGSIPVETVEPEPMTLEEAARRVDETRSGLFIFVNPKTEEINIVHRNRQGQLELMELTGTVLFHPSEEIMALADDQ